jgi:hypothetical protein
MYLKSNRNEKTIKKNDEIKRTLTMVFLGVKFQDNRPSKIEAKENIIRLNSKFEKNQSDCFTLPNTAVCLPNAMVNAIKNATVAKIISSGFQNYCIFLLKQTSFHK